MKSLEKTAEVSFFIDGELLFTEKLYTDAGGKLYAVLDGGLYYEPQLSSSDLTDLLA